MMARSYSPPSTARQSRFGHDEPAREEVRPDGERASGFVWLYGDAIGMTPEELLEHAGELLEVYAADVAVLLRHVPRKFEDRIKALDKPRSEAGSAIRATKILIENQRAVFAAPDYPKED